MPGMNPGQSPASPILMSAFRSALLQQSLIVVLASGPGGATDALAVSGETLTVWRLATTATAWSPVQRISVPVQLGSSG